ncbi:hypothetical protein AB9K34_10430 [Sedimentitalea sp. XS_ASV28]|uniref:hypothetical protein n=1 Tax=Sedimentitalea sp. XS_ASV28 TaxID=3241296 RepID=UPI003511203D
MSNEKTGLAGLLALKAVCCGVLLLALGGVSLGSAISALAGNGWVQAGGVILAAFGVGCWSDHRRRAKTWASGSTGAAKFRGEIPKRERNSVPAE